MSFIRPCVIVIGLILLLLSSCKKNGEKPVNEIGPDTISLDTLIDEQLSLLDQLETDEVTKFADLKFEDGTNMKAWLDSVDPGFLRGLGMREAAPQRIADLSPVEQQRKLFAMMLATGSFIVDDNKHIIIEEGYGKPAQPNGLAYVYGSRQYIERQNAVQTCTTDLRYGLDCAGIIYQMAIQAGLKFSSKAGLCGSVYLGNPDNWNKALSTSAFKNLCASIVTPTPSADEMLLGDIISWKRHIGMVLTNSQTNKLAIFQSNGYNNNKKCAKNNDATHGPNIKVLTDGFLNDTSFGPKPSYKVIRIENNNIKGSCKPNTTCTWTVNGKNYQSYLSCKYDYCNLDGYEVRFQAEGPHINTKSHNVQFAIGYIPNDSIFSYDFGTQSVVAGPHVGQKLALSVFYDDGQDGDYESYYVRSNMSGTLVKTGANSFVLSNCKVRDAVTSLECLVNAQINY